MNAELIAVGTEILLGDIVNTDAQLISRGLSELGINVYYQTVVGDNPERLGKAVEAARERADILITTGGLGPTLDDITKETLAEAFGKKLSPHAKSLEAMRAYFKRAGREMTENNEKQALLPEGCTVFENKFGTAPGCAFESGGKYVVMLPGPPNECGPMWTNSAMPYLKKLAGGCIESRHVRMFGIGESAMETMLRNIMETSENPTLAPYAKTSECCVRITARADTHEECVKLLEPMVDKVCSIMKGYVYGVDVPSLEQALGDRLRELGLTLAVAESCTGGLLSKRITDIPGCSDFYLGGVCSYSNESKINLLGVKPETLSAYGAVSEEVAREMAEGVARKFGSDIGAGITGIAGPGGGTAEKPVGLIYIGVWHGGRADVKEIHAPSGRERARIQAASTALDMIRKRIFADKIR